MSLRRFGRATLYHHTLPHRCENHAPGLHKWWKGWSRVNGKITQHISPYQQKIIAPLFKAPLYKARHKLLDNWEVWPGLLLYAGGCYYMDSRYEQLERHEWA